MEQPPNDHATLVVQASKGDVPALNQLLVEHLPQLERFVRQRADMLPGGREAVTDIVQSACREGLMQIEGYEYRGRAAFVSWLYKVALSKIVQKHRFHHAARRDMNREARSVRQTSNDSQDPTLGEVYATFCTPSRIASGREELSRMAAMINKLPEDYQQVIFLRRVLQQSHAEIAEQMGRSEQACRILLSRAVARLALLLTEKTRRVVRNPRNASPPIAMFMVIPD